MTRDALLNQLDQAQMDLRHARHAAEEAQNPSDKQYAGAMADRHSQRVTALRTAVRRSR